MADFLDEKRKEITNRLRELQPAVDEYRRLEAAAAALGQVGGPGAAGVSPQRRGPGRPRSAGTRAKPTTAAKTTPKKARGPRRRRAGRRKGTGIRAAQALALVQEHPGITIPELAAKMGIKQNYLYRVMPALEEGGRAKRRGRGWHPAQR